MSADVRAAVLALRRAHPRRGPKKLRALLRERAPERAWPAASTIGDLLRREGLSQPRRRTRYVLPLTDPLRAATAPNEVWTADVKGWFRTADGTRGDPLTVVDACRRFVVCCRIVAPTTHGVRPWFERACRPYGLPRPVRPDNGSPFATKGPGRLSSLAGWWLKLGIELNRIDPGHPEQHGRHERFHLTLQEEGVTPPAATVRQQQQRFDRVCRDFNYERPPEALGQRPPARVYCASARPYPATLAEPWYDATHQVRRVCESGTIKWQGDRIFLGGALRGELVGTAETERGDWVVRFMHVELGRIDRQTRRFTPAWHGRRRGGSSRTPWK